MKEAIDSDDRMADIDGVSIVIFIITAIFFLIWIHRAYSNLSSLGCTDLKHSPGWAVGWFFIPILNLWKPYQVTQEIWKASDPDTNINDGNTWQTSPASSIVSLWWFLWVATSLAGYTIVRYLLGADTIGDWHAGTWLLIINTAVEVVAVILAILIVLNINSRQEKKRQLILSST